MAKIEGVIKSEIVRLAKRDKNPQKLKALLMPIPFSLLPNFARPIRNLFSFIALSLIVLTSQRSGKKVARVSHLANRRISDLITPSIFAINSLLLSGLDSGLFLLRLQPVPHDSYQHFQLFMLQLQKEIQISLCPQHLFKNLNKIPFFHNTSPTKVLLANY